MFVTNHVLSGVVIGRLLERRPVAAFVVGVGRISCWTWCLTGVVSCGLPTAKNCSFATQNGTVCWASS